MANQQTGDIKNYINEIRKYLADGDASEYTYRPALEGFLKSFDYKLRVSNDPRGKSLSNNKPDFIVKRGNNPIGYIETKNIGVNLDKAKNSEQLRRYLSEYSNFILTDYIEFRRYVNGSLRTSSSIGKIKGGHISIDTDGCKEVMKIIEDFLYEESHSVITSLDLADRLAKLTRQISHLVRRELSIKEDSAHLHLLMEAFKNVLLSDLNAEKFSDMFAQTLAYGFFAARVHFDGKGEFSRRTASTILPKTNPFLRKLFREFADDNLPESLVGVVDEVVELLRKTDIQKILKEFNREGRNDAVVHFYESFLESYNPELKKEMGVFYTPDPIVDYIVKSLDQVLVQKFSRKRGLADEKTLILDPALGTGSFLNKIIETIHDRTQKGSWDSYVTENMLKRLFGFEILMAPYAVAHLNIGLKLQTTGYSFAKNQRLGIFLTNTLEETAKRSEVLFADWLSEEANAAASIKRDQPIMVVIGNPPYAKESQNDGEWIHGLMRGQDSISGKKCANYFICEGKPLGERNPKWLNDDYVKFIRFAHWRIEQTGYGILAFITNHGYLDNPTFRGMREALMKDFDEIYILDLHGNVKKKEQGPNSEKDENVFNIQQGVSICFLVRTNVRVALSDNFAKVYRADLFGSKNDKYNWLKVNDFESTNFQQIKPISPSFFFIKQDKKMLDEYNCGMKITDVFELEGVGITSARDGFVIDFDEITLLNRIKDFKCFEGSDQQLCEELKISAKLGWDITKSRKMMTETKSLKEHIVQILYRPFDLRKIFYHDALVWRTARKVMQPMLDEKNNIGLVYTRPMAPSYEFTVLITNTIIDQCAVGNKSSGAGISYLAPLKVDGKSNISQEARSLCSAASSDYEILCYIYGVFYSSEFRTRYAAFLKTDFPRVQFTSNRKLFKKIAQLGRELIDLHLLKEDNLERRKVTFGSRGSNIVEKVKYVSKEKRVYINASQYFENISEELWQFDFAGYQVLEKWLKDRLNRKLTHSDVAVYEKVADAFLRTRAIMYQIDMEIGDSGGWPIQTTKKERPKSAA